MLRRLLHSCLHRSDNRGAESDAHAPKKIWTVGTLTYTSAGLFVLFLWLLFGDFSMSMRDRSVGPMAHWYLKHIGVSNLVFSLLLASFPAAVAFVLGPIISVKSDHHRGKYGRRIPFLLITTPAGALGMIGLAVTPYVARWVHSHFPNESEVTVAVICFAIFWASYEFATIAGMAVFGGLVNDVVPKALLGRFYGLFRIISLLDGIVFNYWIMGYVPTHFTLILASVGTFYGVAFMWVCFKVKEGEYPPPPKPSERAPAGAVYRRPVIGHGFFKATATYFRECFTSSYYIAVFIMISMGAAAFLPVNTFAIPYAESVGMDMRFYGRCLSLTFTISLCLSYFIGWMADRFHPIRMGMVALLAYMAVCAWGWTFAVTANTYAVAFVLHAVVSGFYVTSVASLGQRLYPHEKYAQFASAGGMIGSVKTMVLGPFVGILIDRAGSDYRHVFLVGGGLALIGLGAYVYAYRRFMRLGGPENYVAPEA